MMANDFKNSVRRWAETEYFDQVGFTRIEPLPGTISDSFSRWIEKRFYGKMDWMERTAGLRLDPRMYFPEVKSMIVFLHSYHHRIPEEMENLPVRIASYAHGKDYHYVLKKKMRRLTGKISDVTGAFNYRFSIDSAPVLERFWAQKAGLGWQGKNSMLISPRLGSRNFISIILTDLDIEPDPPFTRDLCGICERCVSGCPTAAIMPDRTVNSNHCISYLTIEHKGRFDPSLPETAPWIFGCDACQDVCPWNRFSRETKELRFHPAYSADKIKDLINHPSESKFSGCFAGTAVKRAGAVHFRYVSERISRFPVRKGN